MSSALDGGFARRPGTRPPPVLARLSHNVSCGRVKKERMCSIRNSLIVRHLQRESGSPLRLPRPYPLTGCQAFIFRDSSRLLADTTMFPTGSWPAESRVG